MLEALTDIMLRASEGERDSVRLWKRKCVRLWECVQEFIELTNPYIDKKSLQKPVEYVVVEGNAEECPEWNGEEFEFHGDGIADTTSDCGDELVSDTPDVIFDSFPEPVEIVNYVEKKIAVWPERDFEEFEVYGDAGIASDSGEKLENDTPDANLGRSRFRTVRMLDQVVARISHSPGNRKQRFKVLTIKGMMRKFEQNDARPNIRLNGRHGGRSSSCLVYRLFEHFCDKILLNKLPCELNNVLRELGNGNGAIT